MNSENTYFDTPIRPLIEYVPGSLERVAPERVDDLARYAKGLRMELDYGPGFSFASLSKRKRITVSLRGIEYLWALSYSAWTLAMTYQGLKQQAVNFDVRENPLTEPIPRLLDWSLKNQITAKHSPWPVDTPTPDLINPNSTETPTVPQVASEIALVATAWILHHELAHVRLRHKGHSTESVQNEETADRAATEWVLGKAPKEVIFKRGVGIAVAGLGIAGLALANRNRAQGPHNHPHPADRLFDALDHNSLHEEDRVYAIAALQLNLHLQNANIYPGEMVFDTGRECLNAFCFTLKRKLDW